MIALYPWETVETVEREPIEAEIQADAEFAQWLDEVYADPGPATMTELEFLAYAADQAEAQPAEQNSVFAQETLIWTLFAPRSGGWSAEMLAGEVDVLPEWQRDDYVGA